MSEGASTEIASPLTAVAIQHPEKTYYLGQVFNNTTNSYKLLWFLAILQMLRRRPAQAYPLSDILTEMVVTAWHPVCLFRLSLGRQDKLQDAVIQIQVQSKLAPAEDPAAVRQFVGTSPNAQARLAGFSRYVPTRFLTPWFADKLRGEMDNKRERLIPDLALVSQKTPGATPYWFDADSIRLNESWTTFLVDNMAIVQAFAEHHLALYLQARNPNVPGVVNKLRAPTRRQLSTARQFWHSVRIDLAKAGHPERFQDIYSQQPLGDSFAVDHFLPWSFVVHDLIWNLSPVAPSTNSSKNDGLPALHIYLPRLVKLHFEAINVARKRPQHLEDYTECFQMDTEGLLALGVDGLTAKYQAVMAPQAQIAINQGFQSGWVLRN